MEERIEWMCIGAVKGLPWTNAIRMIFCRRLIVFMRRGYSIGNERWETGAVSRNPQWVTLKWIALIWRDGRSWKWRLHNRNPNDKLGRYEFRTLTSFVYPVEGSNEKVIVATTRLKTMMGDTVAVHPENPWYTHLHGKFHLHPFFIRKYSLRRMRYWWIRSLVQKWWYTCARSEGLRLWEEARSRVYHVSIRRRGD